MYKILQRVAPIFYYVFGYGQQVIRKFRKIPPKGRAVLVMFVYFPYSTIEKGMNVVASS